MANALDYIACRGDLSFEVAPINELDMFLFSQIVMADFRDIISEDGRAVALAEVAERYFEKNDMSVHNLGALQAEETLPAFRAMGKARRYKDIMANHYVNYVCQEDNEQFSATTFILSPNLCTVVYRGTDDYLIGWKEDCYLAFCDEVPAQRDAVVYLERVAQAFPGRILISGHSKGGNLAIYAAAHASKDVQDRIVQVFNYDGPGFPRKFLEEYEGYQAVKDRINTYVSQHSIIGLILDLAGKVVYTKSNVEGPYAHDGFKWEVEGEHFRRVKGISKFSKTFDEVFTSVMQRMTQEEKKKFVDELFNIIFSTGVSTITEFKELGWRTSLGTFGKISASRTTRDFFNKLLVSLISKGG